MPPKQPPLLGLATLSRAGKKWEREKAADLASTFGQVNPEAIIGNQKRIKDGLPEYDAVSLEMILPDIKPHQFIIEPEYEVPTQFILEYNLKRFIARFGLKFARIRPDIIQALGPGTHSKYITSSGTVK